MNPTILPVHMCFKGSRDYLHGTDIYQSLARVASDQFEHSIGRFQMSIHRFSNLEPDIYWYQSGRSVTKPQNSVVEFSISGNGRGAVGWMVETERRVNCRVSYDEDEIAQKCTVIGDSIAIHSDSGCSPIEVAVSMTKQLHNKILHAPAGRWIFTKLDLRRLLEPSDSTSLTISLKENLYGRLTKSEITAGSESIGAIYFSLVR